MSSKFAAALGAYSILGILAAATLTGNVRLFVLLFLAALALKTWISMKRE
jgi:hypothetical protein